MTLLILSMLAAAGQALDPDALFQRTRLEVPEADDEVAQRVLDKLQNPRHWVGAYAAIQQKLGFFPAGFSATVDFNCEGEELAHTASREGKAVISFNLRKLVEGQRHLDDLARKKKEVEGRGGRMVFKVPPVRMDRIIYHELTHALQGACDAPGWFLEGMAQLIGDDPNSLCAFQVAAKKVREIDEPVDDRNDTYARGHLFWKWLESQGMVRKVVGLTVFDHRPWKEALEVALLSDWTTIRADEREWSAKELEKLK